MTARRHLAGGLFVAPGRNMLTTVGFFENTSRVRICRGLPDGLHLEKLIEYCMNWHELAEAIRPYHEIITALSTVVIAVLTIVLAYVAWRQIRDARILQRAYLDVGGIKNNTDGDLVGHVIFKNVGHLPAQKFYWLVRLDSGGRGWSPPKIKILKGESVSHRLVVASWQRPAWSSSRGPEGSFPLRVGPRGIQRRI